MKHTKIGILCLSALVLFSIASVNASASGLPIGLSDRMTIAGSNGGANNCSGNSIVDILEGTGGKDTYKNGVSAVVCNGKYGFGPVEAGSQRDFLQYAVTAKMRSDSGPETGIDPGEADSIIITITAFSYPDGSPLSDLLTVTVKDSMGLYNYTQSVPIFELSNGNDSPGVVTVDLATLTGTGFKSFSGDCCDSVNLSGVIRLQSIPGPLNGDPGTLETTTEVIRIGAYSDATPEPSTLLLLGSGLAGVAGFVHRRKEK